jgi:hypothetical protein
METNRTFGIADPANAAGVETEVGNDEVRSREVTVEDGIEDNVDAGSTPLFADEEAARFRERWVTVQGEFVDRPREAVEQADQLVAHLMQQLASQFSDTRTELEGRWDKEEDVSTEELRVAMTQYRSFFERLLHA